MISESYAYYITLRRRGDEQVLLFNIGSERESMAAIRVNGRIAERAFKGVIETLAARGAVTPVRVSASEETYSVREDVGPIVGAYLILVRRSVNVDKWNSFFRDLMEGHYVGLAKALTAFLEMALDMSRYLPSKGGTTVSPLVADAVSSSMKRFVELMTKGLTK